MLGKIVLWIYRVAYYLYAHRIPFIPTFLILLIRIVFSCDIGLGVKFGKRVNLGHGGLGTVIHFKVVIGDDVSIGSNVTIGGSKKQPEVPIVEPDVLIATGAKILGHVRVGTGSVIAANSVVLKDVPARAIVAGVPAKVVRENIYINDFK